MPHVNISRRIALQLMVSTATAALAVGVAPVMAQAAAGRIIILSDLHSAYERFGQLLAAIEGEIADNPVPHLIVINGDVFEAGNVVSSRSQGAVDWALLEQFAALAPTFLNIGNHEPDVVEAQDLANFVARAREIGVTVLTTIVDTRTGAPYADAHGTAELGELPVTLVGIATAAVTTYPQPTREWLEIPQPAAWAEENLPDLLQADGLNLVLSHAGVVADKAILPLLPDGTLLVGGHDHLRFSYEEGATRYVHTGSWSSVYTIATIGADRSISLEQVEVPVDAAPSDKLAGLIGEMLAAHLTDEERASVGTSPAALNLGDTGRAVAASFAAAAGADVGFIGHTTLGTGLPAGDVSKYVFDSVVRFDGKIVVAQVDREGLAAILDMTNQDRDIPLAAMTGDFLYAAPEPSEDKETYLIAANDWAAINQKAYFGREDLEFSEKPGLLVKTVALDTLG